MRARTSRSRAPGLGESYVRPSRYPARSLLGRTCWSHSPRSRPSAFRDDLSQFRAMYRVFNGDDMEPLTSIEEVLAWRDQEAWWEILVERVTRALTAPGDQVLPFGADGGAQPYRRRYVRRLVLGARSFLQRRHKRSIRESHDAAMASLPQRHRPLR